MDYRTLIDAQSLEAGLNVVVDGIDTVLLDCRFNLMQPDAGLTLYRQGHIPGAIYAHLEDDLSAPVTPTSGRHPLPDPQQLARRLGEWGIGAETQVVVYDDMGGAMAARAWWLLRWLGHERVALLDGGFPAWVETDGAVSDEGPDALKAPTAREPYPFQLNAAWLVSTEAVLSNLTESVFTLVDARTSERFLGQQEPIDPVAGHVPGALNRPLPDNLTEAGTFKSTELLKSEWLAVLAAVKPKDAVMMCGSGVTACHHLLALEVAGLSGARLYAGSWSEWIRDPARPVVSV